MINSIVLAGNVVVDPESRSTNSGKVVATIRLAVNNPINDKDTVFIDVEVWEKQAEFVTNYVKKGSAISVIGRLKQDSWEKDGKKMSKILVVAERVNFLGSKKKSEDSDSEQEEAPQRRPQQASKFAPRKPEPKKYSKQNAQEDLDEDVPI